MTRYTVHTLDMWGHVPADCVSHGCSPCVTDEKHDDDACQCHEDCNQQFKRGTIEVPKDATDAAVLAALTEDGFSLPAGSVLDDYSDGPLDVNDADGRRLLHLIPEDDHH